MLGDYDYGDGRKEKDPNYMTFFDRNTNFPWKSHGIWWLTQFRRWGMVKGAPDYTGIVNKVMRPDIYREVAKEMSVTVPKEDMKKRNALRQNRIRSGQAGGVRQEICRQQCCLEVFGKMEKRIDSAAMVLPLLGIRLGAADLDDDQFESCPRSAVTAEDLAGKPSSIFSIRSSKTAR